MRKKQSGRIACCVSMEGDHHVIRTTPRRAQAILMVLAGGTLEEVGQHFGVTRERIRQYVAQAGIKTGDRQIQKESMGTERWLRSAGRRRASFAERQRRIHRGVGLIWGFATKHGRPPTHNELATMLLGRAITDNGCVYIAGHLGRYSKHGESQADRVHALYRLAGFPKRRVGCWTGGLHANGS